MTKTRTRRAEWVLLAATTLVTVVALANLVGFQHGRDQAVFSTIGRMVLDGRVPYREAWDLKPPGIYFLYAAIHGVFGAGQTSVRLAEALFLVSLLFPFRRLSDRYLGSARAGVLGWAMAVYPVVRLEFWNTAQTESFGGVVVAWAVWLASTAGAQAPARRRRLTEAGAGMLFGIAGLLKPFLGAALLASWLATGAARRRSDGTIRAFAASGATMAVGAAIPVAATVLWFAAHHAVRDLVDALFVFGPQYAKITARAEFALPMLYRTLADWLVKYSPFHVAGLLLLGLLRPRPANEKAGTFHLGGVIVLLLAGVTIQGKFFGYHYDAALLLGGLLAGWGFWKLWTRVRRSRLGIVAFAVGFALLPFADRTSDRVFWQRCLARANALRDRSARDAIHDELYSSLDMNRRAIRETAGWIAANTPPDARVFVWGFDPLIYVMADRTPASRYIHDIPQRVSWDRTAARENLLRDLRERPPEIVVLQGGDVFFWATGNRDDSLTALRTFPELVTFLDGGYEVVEEIRPFLILRRKP